MDEIAADIGKGPRSILTDKASVTPQEEISPAVITNGAVNMTQQEKAIHRRAIPGIAQPAQRWNLAVDPEAVAVEHEEWLFAKQRQSLCNAATRVKNFGPLIGKYDFRRRLLFRPGQYLVGQIVAVDNGPLNSASRKRSMP